MQSQNQIKWLNNQSNKVSNFSVFLHSTLRVSSLKTLTESQLSTLNSPWLNIIQIRVLNSSDFHINPSCLSVLSTLFKFFQSLRSLYAFCLYSLVVAATPLPLQTLTIAAASSPNRSFLTSLSFDHGLSLSLLVSASQYQVLFLHFSSIFFYIFISLFLYFEIWVYHFVQIM